MRPRACVWEQLGRAAIAAGVAVVIGAIAGCGRAPAPEPPPGLVPAAGRVVLAGKPLPGVVVTLFDAAGTATAAGLSDAEGRVRLATFPNHDGVRPGLYRVTCEMQPPDTYAGESVVAASPIPARFTRPGTTPLTVTVPAVDWTVELK